MASNIFSLLKPYSFSPSNSESGEQAKQELNTFYGVFLPSLLSIFGVIMYLRLGTVVGSVGIFGALFIVIFSSMITFITSLSISSTATNMHVEGGGALSSAIGALLGAPRTLQALAKDGIVPKFLSALQGINKEPRNATAVTFLIASLALYFGNINVIAPVLSMFFLVSYGMLNLASGIESFLENPSWRPTFYTPWYISFTGAFLCLFAMLMIDPGATFMSLIALGMIYTLTKRKNLSNRWEDIQQGALLFCARFAIYRLASQKASVRSWRPNFLVFSRSPTYRSYLIQFASSITNNKGFMTVACLLTSEGSDQEKAERTEELIRNYLKKKKIQSLVEVNSAQDVLEGMKKIITSYGLGPISPNTIVIGYSPKEESLERIATLVYHANDLGKNVIMIKCSEEDEEPTNHKDKVKKKVIDIWWDSAQKKNNDLMMVLANMLRGAPEWRNFGINIQCVVPNETAREQRLEHFNKFFLLSRLNITPKVLVVTSDESHSANTISKFCSDSSFLFAGLPPITPTKSVSDYAQELQQYLHSMKSIPNLALVLNSDDIELDRIFS